MGQIARPHVGGEIPDWSQRVFIRFDCLNLDAELLTRRQLLRLVRGNHLAVKMGGQVLGALFIPQWQAYSL
jgi:hypothetical protein